MIYNNLIYLLVVILILSTSSVPTEPQIATWYALLIFLGKGLLFVQLARKWFRVPRGQASYYFAAEQRLSILAVASLAIDVYLLDCLYYLAKIPFAGQIPALMHIGGLCLFFFYLVIMWIIARSAYGEIFDRSHSLRTFLGANLKTNLAIVLPWLILTLASDLLQLVDLPLVQDLLASPWAEPLLFLMFFIVLVIALPAVIVRLWGCTPMPPGEARSAIEAFCRRQNLQYAEIMLWPLFEGRMLTAGVLGMVKRFRYLLVTPALLETMSPVEIEAVMAHEIGHVKRHHLPLYLLLFLGFGFIAQLSTYPLLALILRSDFFYTALEISGKTANTAITFVSTFFLLILILVYFRYIFGFFMRNFERQADLYALETMKSAEPLVSVFEKIAWLSGKIRDLPSWHHFGLGERIDFLLYTQRRPELIKRQDRKVRGALIAYLALLTVAMVSLWQMPNDLIENAPKSRLAAIVQQKIDQEPKNPLWHHVLGDIQFSRKLYPEAIMAYEEALSLNPGNPEALNNLAWLLLTAEKREVVDPDRALLLAEKAVKLKPAGHILDTLATAYWANGYKNLAVETEKRAMEVEPAEKNFYSRQIERFQSTDFSPTGH